MWAQPRRNLSQRLAYPPSPLHLLTIQVACDLRRAPLSLLFRTSCLPRHAVQFRPSWSPPQYPSPHTWFTGAVRHASLFSFISSSFQLILRVHDISPLPCSFVSPSSSWLTLITIQYLSHNFTSSYYFFSSLSSLPLFVSLLSCEKSIWALKVDNHHPSVTILSKVRVESWSMKLGMATINENSKFK